MPTSLDLIQSPFPRLRALLEGIAPPEGLAPIDMTIGEPRHPLPEILAPALAEAAADYAKYPPIQGTPELRAALADWHRRRYGIDLDVDREVMVLNGSREGIVSAIVVALAEARAAGRDRVLMPNPFYQCYAAGAISAGGEPVLLDTGANTGFLPDLEALAGDADLLARTAAFVLCSPANPQGAVADPDYLSRALDLARRHGFWLLMDECYSEIYSVSPPPGILEVASARTGSLSRAVSFNSLSKRSNVPGLRSGFVAGDATFLSSLQRFRNVAAPQTPVPVQHASAVLWSDEAHVEASRDLYREKFDLADRILGNALGYRRPAGGFFLWLETARFGGGEAAAVTLWKGYGVKVLPGAYLGQPDPTGHNPGAPYVRVALVHDRATTSEALQRIVELAK